MNLLEMGHTGGAEDDRREKAQDNEYKRSPLRGKVAKVTSFIALTLAAAWCALKASVWIGIYGYRRGNLNEAHIAANAHTNAQVYLGLSCLAIGVETWILSRSLTDLWNETLPMIRYLGFMIFAIFSVVGTIAVILILESVF